MAKYLDYAGLQYLWAKIKNYVSTQPLGANVRYDQQTLTSAQQAQARKNIGAGGSNDNLLDNAYFVGGGSQLWDGAFPINQRGITFYSLSYGNIFDRWHIQGSATATCTLNANGIAFAADTENCGLSQTIPAGRIVDGKTYTLSVMDTARNIYSGSRVLNTNDSWQHFNLGLSAFGWYNPCYVAANGQTNVYILDRTGSGVSASIGIAAAKLELGTISTLANDVPPDFGAELAKCQRRLFRVSPMGTSQRGYAGFGSANSGKNILVFVPTPATLAAQPTVSFSNCNAYNYVAGGSIAISSISIDSWTQNGVFLSCTPSDASQVVQYQPYVLRIAQGGYLQFSAEL